jgi:hypothetical protein
MNALEPYIAAGYILARPKGTSVEDIKALEEFIMRERERRVLDEELSQDEEDVGMEINMGADLTLLQTTERCARCRAHNLPCTRPAAGSVCGACADINLSDCDGRLICTIFFAALMLLLSHRKRKSGKPSRRFREKGKATR